MRKLLPLVVFLLISASAQASSPPDLKDTAPYKSLRSYVFALEKKSSASESKKNTYRNELRNRSSRASQEKNKLFVKRRTLLQQKYKRGLRRQYRDIEQTAKRQQKRALLRHQRKRKAAKRLLQKRESDTRAFYSKKINPLLRRIKALQKRKRQSDDQREKALLAEEIIILQREVNRLEVVVSTEVFKAKRVYRREVRTINLSQEESLREIKKKRRRERQKALASQNTFREQALVRLRAQRTREGLFVQELLQRGETAIDIMT
jgi:hypothetical protein